MMNDDVGLRSINRLLLRVDGVCLDFQLLTKLFLTQFCPVSTFSIEVEDKTTLRVQKEKNGVHFVKLSNYSKFLIVKNI